MEFHQKGNDVRGPDPNLVDKLARLEWLEQHHRHCKMPALLRPPPALPKVSGSNPEATSQPDQSVVQIPASLGASSEDLPANVKSVIKEPNVKFIQYELPKPKPPTKRWMEEARKTVAQAPTGKQWSSEWLALGVSSEHHSKAVIASVLRMGEGASEPTPLIETSPDRTFSGPFDRLSAYAKVIQTSGQSASLASCVTSFQKLVYASACIALKKHKLLTSIQTRELIRLSISDSTSDPYVDKLQSGALWVNQTINGLSCNGWGHRASPLFFLLNRNLAQYGRFTEDSDASREHFERHLISEEYVEGVTPVPALEGLSIPSLVQYLIGNYLTLTKICDALGYSAVKPLGVASTKRKRDTSSTRHRKPQAKRKNSTLATTSHSLAESEHANWKELEDRRQRPRYSSVEHAGISSEGFIGSQTYGRNDGDENATEQNTGYNASTGIIHTQGVSQGSKDDTTQPHQVALRPESRLKTEETVAVASPFMNGAQQAHGDTNGQGRYSQKIAGGPPESEPDLSRPVSDQGHSVDTLFGQNITQDENQCFGTKNHGQTYSNSQTNLDEPEFPPILGLEDFQPDLFMGEFQPSLYMFAPEMGEPAFEPTSFMTGPDDD